MTITVENKTQLAIAEKVCADLAELDPNFNGQDFEFQVGDWFSVDSCDGLKGMVVFNAIKRELPRRS